MLLKSILACFLVYDSSRVGSPECDTVVLDELTLLLCVLLLVQVPIVYCII